VLGTHADTHVVFSSSLPFARWISQLDESVDACFFPPSSMRPHLKCAFGHIYRKLERHPKSVVYIHIEIIPAMLVISLSTSCVSLGVHILKYSQGYSARQQLAARVLWPAARSSRRRGCVQFSGFCKCSLNIWFGTELISH
jgi:hypothetical protein